MIEDYFAVLFIVAILMLVIFIVIGSNYSYQDNVRGKTIGELFGGEFMAINALIDAQKILIDKFDNGEFDNPSNLNFHEWVMYDGGDKHMLNEMKVILGDSYDKFQCEGQLYSRYHDWERILTSDGGDSARSKVFKRKLNDMSNNCKVG